MMAKLEISFPYRTLSKQKAIAFGLVWAAFGAWMAMQLVAIFITLGHVYLTESASRLILELLFVFGSAAVYAYVPFRLATTCLQANSICANQDGLGLPGSVFGNSRWLPWSQLKVARETKGKVELEFNPGGTVKVDPKQISADDLEQFLLALEVWGQKGIWATSLIELRDQLQNKKAGLEDHSYTKMWEEELNRRFNSTTFIPLEPGHKLRSESFTIVKQLAFGGFSAVYLAEDSNRQQVVIKESVTNSDDATHAKALEFFKREAMFLGNLRHEQIAHVLDNFIEKGRNYLVLQYIPGDNLREYVRKTGALEEHMVLDLMTQMAGVLGYLHDQNPPIVHRDFTPDNLVLQPDGSIVVIDFGAANEYVGAATGTLIGKQCYMPPEQVRGKCVPATDLYALGCTASFLLTGHDPEALTVCHPRLEKPAISIKTDTIISELTQQDSKKRMQSAQQLLNVLQEKTPVELSLRSLEHHN